jgi:fructosamine-3-kinase
MAAKLDSGVLTALSASNLTVESIASSRIITNDPARSFFLKTRHDTLGVELFEAEGLSLRKLREIAPNLLPAFIAQGKLADSQGAFFMSEYIALSSLQSADQTVLGTRLAEMHKVRLCINSACLY